MTNEEISQALLLDQLGSNATNRLTERFARFCSAPKAVIDGLTHHALSEDWGRDDFVLYKYLAVQVPWSIEQGLFTRSGRQFYTTAGNLQTRYGTPIYLVFEKNRVEGRQPWCIIRAAPNISAPELPDPPVIPTPTDIQLDAEVVMAHDHILGEHASRVPFLQQTPPVAQMCAVTGAIQWSLFRQLHFPYFYYGRMNYLVPLYLQSRENIAQMQDLVAPIQISTKKLYVRTVLEPHMPYANARVSVKRHDQLPPWLLDTWRDYSSTATDEQTDDTEPAAGDVGATSS